MLEVLKMSSSTPAHNGPKYRRRFDSDETVVTAITMAAENKNKHGYFFFMKSLLNIVQRTRLRIEGN